MRRAACEQSLKDLGIATIDLLYVHRPDPSVPLEETIKAMAVSRLCHTSETIGIQFDSGRGVGENGPAL